MDISFQEPQHFSSDISTSSVQLCTRDVHIDLKHGNTDSLKEWMNSGKSARCFIKKAISYPYKVRYRLMRTLCHELVKDITIPHPGFYLFGRKRLYEWAFWEMLERCSPTLLHINDPDEQWAFHMISLVNLSESEKYERWENILEVFDGSVRWVRLLAAFFCSISNTQDTLFNRYNMTKGWFEWMNATHGYELLRCIYPLFSNKTPEDAMAEDNGEISMMGLVWACTHDEPLRYITCIHENQCINDGIYTIFYDDDDEMILESTDSISESDEEEEPSL